MENEIQKIALITRTGSEIQTLFDVESDVSYVVPLYQRAFAWGENEIVQLMDDIYDSTCDGNYYLGSLVVSRKDGNYEVIDGQQRLTALFLLFHCLGLRVKNSNAFSYACREKSNYAIRRIEDLIRDEALLESPYEESIYEGIKTIRERIRIEKNRDPRFEKNLLEAFQHVFLFRICVPAGTDLNRYFEVMNTRGEQLEQHDIVKAMLMRPLTEDERSLFSEVWNACRDMTGYVQMHFCKAHREGIFQKDWTSIPDIHSVATDSGKESAPSESLSLSDIISPTFKVDTSDGVIDNDGRIRFESIIGFTHFLLHVLKVFIADVHLVHSNPDIPLVGELIDDKKLISSFENARKNGVVNGRPLPDRDFSWKFLDCLLKCRFLFDKFIIKREFKEENSDGEWSLQELKKGGSRNHEHAYYVKTEFREKFEREARFSSRKDKNLMIQACLRVSYTSPKVMHWITKLLSWLYKDGSSNTAKLSSYLDVTEGIARQEVGNFLSEPNALEKGVNTPHIVLNFLDYLLWKDNDNPGDPFVFEFRNSVEHWYPQHPSDGMFEPMDHVDRFGNLCLIQSKVNAKFSNLSPDSKKSSFKDMIAKGSLKLRIMSEQTTTAEAWRKGQCSNHEEKMISILRTAVSGSQKSAELCMVSIPKDLSADQWVDILQHEAGVLLENDLRICQWEKFSGTDWMELLSERPEFADKCDWSKLSGGDWALLLRSRPEFADKCDKWTEMDEEDWTCLLGSRPQFSKRQECPLPELGGSGWSAVLCGCPEMAEQCPWDRLNGSDWASLLQLQPQFADRCPWDRLNGLDWETLLVSQPQFGTWCNWNKLAGINWAVLLKAQPQFADKCRWGTFRGYDWAVLLGGRPEFSDRCQWSVLTGPDWVKLLSDNPSFEDRCPWDKLDDNDWDQLLYDHPQFADKRPVS